jgi:hypothetical protein
MADSALLASLLLGQKRRSDPVEAQHKFGQSLMTTGASTAPVHSPLEGLARALQGGLGAFVSYDATRREDEKNKATVAGLSAAMQADTPEKAAKALQDAGGDPDLVSSTLAQLLTAKSDRYAKNNLATDAYRAAGGVIPGAQPAGPQSAATPPLPQGQPAPGGFNNNTGNIRASSVPWEGKGVPQNGFETFDTPQAGTNAQAKNWGAYVQGNPNITVAQAIAKWAPPTENDTNQYIRQVAEGTGINPGMPLGELQKDPVAFAQFMEAVTKKEKGGVPQGVTADTFVNAAGGGNAQQPGQLTINMRGPQPPQGSADGSMPPQAAPQAPTAPQISPAAAELSRQAQAAYSSGDPARAAALQQKAQETQAAYLGEQAKIQDTRNYQQVEDVQKRAAEATEHDRREATKTMSREQSDAATFADRMTNSNRIIADLEKVGTSQGGHLLESKVFGVGIPFANRMQSPEYKKFMQAREDFAYAQLRRETGAAIQPFEYETIDKQYMPQPGDDAELLAQKAKNRKIALEGMTRAAGPTYTVNSTVNERPAGTTQMAPAAPSPGAMVDGYRFRGGDPSKRENWERSQ